MDQLSTVGLRQPGVLQRIHQSDRPCKPTVYPFHPPPGLPAAKSCSESANGFCVVGCGSLNVVRPELPLRHRMRVRTRHERCLHYITCRSLSEHPVTETLSE